MRRHASQTLCGGGIAPGHDLRRVLTRGSTLYRKKPNRARWLRRVRNSGLKAAAKTSKMKELKSMEALRGSVL